MPTTVEFPCPMWPRHSCLPRRHSCRRLAEPLFALFLISAMLPTSALAADLSKYRDFELGTDLSTVAQQAGANPSEAKIIHDRPALIQELKWSPRPLGSSVQTEPAKEVIFTFYNGKLFQIAVDYDRYETEGLTAGDFVDAISATYGTAQKAPAAAPVPSGSFSEPQEVLAQWQDPQYRFELVRLSYGLTFRLVGTMKSLEAEAEAASVEAKLLDAEEAPKREAARIVSEDLAVKARLEKARLVNKPKFRP